MICIIGVLNTAHLFAFYSCQLQIFAKTFGTFKDNSYICSVAWKPLEVKASDLILRERRFRTSVVVEHELLKLDNLQQADGNEASTFVRFYMHYYIVRTSVG